MPKNTLIIDVNKNYYIELDLNKNHSLYRKMTVKKEGSTKGQEYGFAIGHYSNVASALKALLHDTIVTSDQVEEHITLEQYIYELEKIYERIFADIDMIGKRLKDKIIELKELEGEK